MTLDDCPARAAGLDYRLAGFAALNWIDDTALMALMFCSAGNITD